MFFCSLSRYFLKTFKVFSFSYICSESTILPHCSLTKQIYQRPPWFRTTNQVHSRRESWPHSLIGNSRVTYGKYTTRVPDGSDFWILLVFSKLPLSSMSMWIVVLVYTKTVRYIHHKKNYLDDFFTCHGCKPGRHFYPSCSEVNNKGYSEYDEPIRARVQRYPLF